MDTKNRKTQKQPLIIAESNIGPNSRLNVLDKIVKTIKPTVITA